MGEQTDARDRAFSVSKDENHAPEFRALVETIGISQSDLAARLGVRERQVRRWMAADPVATDDAWALVRDAREAQMKVVSHAVRRALSVEREIGHKPESVNVSYYATMADFEACHTEEDGLTWGMCNANSRLVAFALERRGFVVHFATPTEKSQVYQPTDGDSGP